MTQHGSVRLSDEARETRLRSLAAEWSALDASGAGISLTGAEAAEALLQILDTDTGQTVRTGLLIDFFDQNSVDDIFG